MTSEESSRGGLSAACALDTTRASVLMTLLSKLCQPMLLAKVGPAIDCINMHVTDGIKGDRSHLELAPASNHLYKHCPSSSLYWPVPTPPAFNSSMLPPVPPNNRIIASEAYDKFVDACDASDALQDTLLKRFDLCSYEAKLHANQLVDLRLSRMRSHAWDDALCQR